MAGTNAGDASIRSAVKDATPDASHALSSEAFHQQMSSSNSGISSDRAVLPGSSSAEPAAKAIGDVSPTTQMDVSVYLKSNQAEIDKGLAQMQNGGADYSKLSDADFAKKFGPSQQSVQDVERFAKQYGLNVKDVNAAAGVIDITGSSDDMQKAFGTKLQEYQDKNNNKFVAQVGAISLPTDVSNDIQAVLGLDNRAVAQTGYVRLQDTADNGALPKDAHSFMPQDVAKAYNFPMDKGGAGSGVGIVELGGGIDLKDNLQYYKDNNLTAPNVNVIEVDGAKNTPGDPNGADGEVMLDSQVIGTVASKATQNMAFAPNTYQGFADAVSRLTFPQDGEAPNQAISISWGSPEASWNDQASSAMRSAIQKAALKGINVFAASGDGGAHDGRSDYQADSPGSIPEAISTGGTRLEVGPDGKPAETVWNSGEWGGAGGGGISEKYPVPDYQKGVDLPASANKGKGAGRGVPDIAGDADPETGYTVRTDGQTGSIGGTSAVAPLYAALTALLTTENGGKSVGWLTPELYKLGESGQGHVFNDVTQGDNNGYKAGKGWDAATGWGSINGMALLKALQAEQNKTSDRV